ncbi:uncharacterized protein LOC110883122 [Helianthus annuus]|uniref:uncharacterized protein LOC110883122 n=1 Tax=Helianthus annuus TaxID=4232 RepID=UPI000B8FBB84|nr:uncharacterized protein LOC110883122 [Helianthus annuus]
MNFLSVNLRGLGGALKSDWIRSIRRDQGINFVMIQESKHSGISHSLLSKFWGSGNFGWEAVDSVGQSGGIVSMWDESLFSLEVSTKNRNFLFLRGRLIGSNTSINVLNVYAPQGVLAKKAVWDLLASLIDSNDGYWFIGGDFNAVRFREEKRNCSFKHSCASNFNSFIFDPGLIEYDFNGRQFTW